MSGARRLKPVADLAKHDERSAARQHGDSLREYQQQQGRLEELVRYRDQYMEQFNEAGKAGLSIVQLRDYQAFLARINQAILQQRQHVQHGQQKSDETQQQWVGKRNRSQMIDKVVETRSMNEQMQQERREQRESDDRVHNPKTGG